MRNPSPDLGQRLVDRADYPVLESVTYMDTASLGLVAESIQDSVDGFARTIAAEGTAGFDDEAETGLLADARKRIALLFGADPLDLAIVISASEALNQIAWWRRPQAGERIVCAASDFPSVTYPWLRVARETGAEVVLAPSSDPLRSVTTDDIVAQIDERVAVVAISHVQYADGYVVDVARISAAARAAGALFVLDATQSAGAVPIDVATLGADVLITSGYKWLCGGSGVAVCWLAPELRAAFDPPFVGWRSTETPFAMDAMRMPLAEGARKMEYGTPYYPGVMALAASADGLRTLGVERINAHVRGLCEQLRTGLEPLGGTAVAPDGPDASGIVSARFADRDEVALTRALKDAGVALACRAKALRFSLHFYNDATDVDRVLAHLDRALRGAS